MKEKERISNLEELMAEALIRLDHLENGQSELRTGQKGLINGQAELETGQQKLETGQQKLEAGQVRLEGRMNSLEVHMLELAKNQISLNDRQSDLQENMINLIQVVKQNSVDIEITQGTMSTREGLNNLFEAMMNRFDKADTRMDFMQADITSLKTK